MNLKKRAIVGVHFGTTFEETREKTIDVINKKLKKEFPTSDFFSIYTSRMINKKLFKKGIQNLNTLEILEKLLKEEYKNIIFQPTYIINGIEMDALRREIGQYNEKFDDIRIGDPLLTTTEDYFNLLNFVEEEVGNLEKNEAIVMIGHGTSHSSHSAYPMLDYIARDLDKPIYIGTVEGYPGVEKVVKELKLAGKEKVILMPLMFVAGNHAKKDIQDFWKVSLEENGFEVVLNLKALGEIEKIQNMYIKKAKKLEEVKPEDILLKKLNYSK
ncbi:MAG: sirohydrochlorin cobaltochelatase [Cetobacterium sp.]